MLISEAFDKAEVVDCESQKLANWIQDSRETEATHPQIVGLNPENWDHIVWALRKCAAAMVISAAVPDKLRQLSKAATQDWCIYSEPEVGLPSSLFAGHVGQVDFGPIEPLQGYDLDLAVTAVNFVRDLIAAQARVEGK